MINPTLAQAHLNKGEAGMVQKTPLVGNLMDAGAASKVALNPQQNISAQQLMTKVGQDADTAVIGKIAEQEGAMRTAQLKQSQAEQDAAQAVSFQKKAVIVAERIYGVDHPETLVAYVCIN